MGKTRHHRPGMFFSETEQGFGKTFYLPEQFDSPVAKIKPHIAG